VGRKHVEQTSDLFCYKLPFLSNAGAVYEEVLSPS